MYLSSMRNNIILGHCLFVINNLLLLNLASYLTLLIVGSREVWRQVMVSAANFAILIYAIELLLGLIGYLTSLAVTAVLCIFTIPIMPVMKTKLGVWFTSRRTRDSLTIKANEYTLTFYIAFGMLAVMGSIWTYQALFQGTNFIWDDLSYHAFIPAKWLVEGKITLVPYPYQTYYPYNAELISLWFMLPYANDAFVSITALYWGILAVIAIFSIVYLLTRSPVSAGIASILFLASTSIQESLHTFSSVDLAGAAMALAAIAFAYGADTTDKNERLINWGYCGLLTGFAAGIKISLLPLIPIILLYLLLRAIKNEPKKLIITGCLLFLLGCFVACGFWYARNFIITGNPLFPAAFGPFAGPFSQALQHNSSLFFWIYNDPFNIRQISGILRNLLDWPKGIGALSVLGYVVAFYLFIRCSKPSQKNTGYTNLLFITGLLLFVLFPLTPFSGRHEEPNSFLMVHNRYIIPSFAIGLILFVTVPSVKKLYSWVGTALAILAFIFAWRYDLKISLIVLSAGLTVVFLFWKYRHLFFNPLSWVSLISIIVLLLPLYYQNKKHLTDENMFAWCDTCYMDGKNLLPAGRAWRELEKLPQGSRIGFLTSVPIGNAHYYPALGRSLQHVPLPLKLDGSLQEPLHITWDWLGLKDQKRPVNPQDFLLNLQNESVEYLIMTHDLFTDTWPMQKKMLDDSASARRIYEDGFSIVWEINKKPVIQ
jgi:hypothetical protein